ncbi:hypothetical protein M231_04407 [Tremella mesenterica]|uniref:Thioredoxin domain-containing protein n=1 Tax=Tremella mesenterica TaxID=5217 RepID=A0A4Q1BKS6_TREME|nr:hypothetical protein M231_04407 [Tremella mesenterica]
MQDPSHSIGADVLPSPVTWDKVRQSEVFDKEGNKIIFGDLVKDKRMVVIFIRHFWCGNCQAYTSQLGQQIPPSSLPSGTSIIIIGCGSYQPIQAYQDLTNSPYPIYANPSLSLYTALQFSSKLAGSKKGEEKEYEKDLGGLLSRTWTSLKNGPGKNFGHVGSVGPKSQNGGEMIVEAGE